jgi:predicted nucleotidyltransferase
MDQATIKGLIDYLKQSLIDNGITVNSIALFGSALNGNMNLDSDLDLIIISPDFENMDIFERAKLTMKSEVNTLRKYKVPMDIINISVEEFKNSNIKAFYKYKIVA